MSRFARFVAQRFPWGPYAQLQRSARDVRTSQRQALIRLLQQAANTEFGRRHHFSALVREKDPVTAYQRNVPLATDADLRPEFDRMLHGEPDVLWPGLCRYGAVSGGTTTHGKLFPVMDEFLRDLESFGLCTTLAYLAERGEREFLRGKILTLGGTVLPNPEYSGLLTGEMSGVMNYNILRGKSKPPSWMAVPPCNQPGLSWDEKLDLLAEQALPQDIRILAACPSWGVQLLRKVLHLARERNGSPAQTIGELWPNLRLVIAGGDPLAPYRAAWEEVIGLPQLDMRETYSATQSSIAFQSTGDDLAMQLWVGGSIFFEFVPWEEYGGPDPQRLTLAELEVDVPYVPYLTTCNGLWSFCLEDVLRFTSLQPPKLLVVGRTLEIINTMGEGLLREHVQAGLESASREADAQVGEYHLAPYAAANSQAARHQLLLEFERVPASLSRFGEAFDETLQNINAKYRKWRVNGGMDIPLVVELPRGTFHRWLHSTRSEVRSQSKIPRLRETRVIAEALLQLADPQAEVPSL